MSVSLDDRILLVTRAQGRYVVPRKQKPLPTQWAEDYQNETLSVDIRTAQPIGVLKNSFVFLVIREMIFVLSSSDPIAIVVSGYGTVHVYNLGKNRSLFEWETSPTAKDLARTSCATKSHSGSYIGLGGLCEYDDYQQRGLVQVRHAEKGTFMYEVKCDFTGHRAIVTAVCFHRNDTHVISGDDSGIVMVWDIETLATCCILQGHSTAITKIVCADESHFVTADRFVARQWGEPEEGWGDGRCPTPSWFFSTDGRRELTDEERVSTVFVPEDPEAENAACGFSTNFAEYEGMHVFPFFECKDVPVIKKVVSIPGRALIIFLHDMRVCQYGFFLFCLYPWRAGTQRSVCVSLEAGCG